MSSIDTFGDCFRYNQLCNIIRVLVLLVRAPPVTLLPEARYDEVMSAFGGRGFLVRTAEELRSALELSLSDWGRPSLLNVLIDPSSDRKQQVTALLNPAPACLPAPTHLIPMMSSSSSLCRRLMTTCWNQVCLSRETSLTSRWWGGLRTEVGETLH